MAETGSATQYCVACGTAMPVGTRFCPNCGKATSTEIAAKPKGDDRRTISYILGFLIIGVGHMIIGRIARGIGFFVTAIVLGAIWGTTGSMWWGFFVFALWAFQLYDLYRINNGRPLF